MLIIVSGGGVTTSRRRRHLQQQGSLVFLFSLVSLLLSLLSLVEPLTFHRFTLNKPNKLPNLFFQRTRRASKTTTAKQQLRWFHLSSRNSTVVAAASITTAPPTASARHERGGPFVSEEWNNSKNSNEKKVVVEKAKSVVVNNAHDLRHMVLDKGLELQQISNLSLEVANFTVQELQNHQVLQLIRYRFQTGSTPGNRDNVDTARLALSLEGGGMRGAVSAGMAAAIACLGLTDSFDAIYGSSAGSVVGAYMVSRQMCIDVYTSILPAAQKTFVCTNRMLSMLAANAVDLALSKFAITTSNNKNNNTVVTKKRIMLSDYTNPGMNLSFVLDGVMDDLTGIRPLDLERFRENDQKQPLRIVSSYVDTTTDTSDGKSIKRNKLKLKCFGSEDFFPVSENENDGSTKTATPAASSGAALTTAATKRADGARHGIYACLEASMTVPGATGPPVAIVDSKHNRSSVQSFFDAFCFEPLPYRSAVEQGATHVLVLCSRPEGFQPVVKPGLYERAIAPIYFRSHDQPEVARFFEQGGQQYIYAEDLLTLEEGKRSLEDPIFVPPAEVLYGVDDPDPATQRLALERSKWNKAHILPLKVPMGTPELATLEQERGTVIEALRGGFAAAFDLLAPAIGLVDQEDGLFISGMEAAKLIFPEGAMDDNVLDKQIRVVGDSIADASVGGLEEEGNKRLAFLRRIFRSILRRTKGARSSSSHQHVHEDSTPAAATPHRTIDSEDDNSAAVLLASLPGLKEGKMAHLAQGLRSNLHWRNE